MPTGPAASRAARRAPTPSRDWAQSLSHGWRAVIPQSWGCRCTTPPGCWRRPASQCPSCRPRRHFPETVAAQYNQSVDDETKNTHMPVRPAATIALLRDGPAGPEVLLLRRSTRHVFAASMDVYPGGGGGEADGAGQLLDRYASGDRDRAQAQLAESDARAYWAAATRECFEEAGVLVGCSAGQPLHRETLATARDELNAGVSSWHDLVTRVELLV